MVVFAPLRFAGAALALEARIFAAGLALLTGCARAPRDGHSYTRNQNAITVLWCAPVMLLPEMVLLDVLLARWPSARLASDLLHVYLTVWALGVIAALRGAPHRVTAVSAELRLGPFMRATLPLDAILSVRVRRQENGRSALRAERAGSALFTLPDADALVEVELKRPIRVERALHAPRSVSRLLIVADRPHDFAAALSR